MGWPLIMEWNFPSRIWGQVEMENWRKVQHVQGDRDCFVPEARSGKGSWSLSHERGGLTCLVLGVANPLGADFWFLFSMLDKGS